MKHPTVDNPDYRCLAIAAARLRGDGANQKEIAARLKKSQPEISRLLSFAAEQRFLARAPAVLRQNIPDADWQQAERQYFTSEEVAGGLKSLAPPNIHFDVRVLPQGDGDFPPAAAGHVVELVRRATRIGVMWGRTLLTLIDAIVTKGPIFGPGETREVECIPLCGDPIFLINLRMFDYSSSHLAAELGRAIDNSRRSNLPCLSAVPAYLSRKVFNSGAENGISWEDFLQDIPGYRAIFGGTKSKAPGLADGIDTILTGAGVVVMGDEYPGHETGDFITERIAQEGIRKETLNDLIYGDVGGLLLERKNLKSKDQKLVEELNRGWTGLKASQLRRVAEGARAGGPPGVIVVAAGANKAEMVSEVVRRGYVNELVIDSALAEALKSG